MSRSALVQPGSQGGGMLRRLSDLLFAKPWLLLVAFLAPPLLWLLVIYIGSLIALLAHAAFSIDEFSGQVVHTPTTATLLQLLQPANRDIILRTLGMAIAVTIMSAMIAYPFCYFAARYAKGKWKAVFYLLVMLPLWSSYLVKVYAWKLMLAQEGIISWTAQALGLGSALDALLASRFVEASSLSSSSLGTFIVFVYIWLPYMILPTQASLERVPNNLIEASGDLGAKPRQTFRHVIWPLALPGLIAGSIFTFSLTLGDYIIPSVIGNSTYYLGNSVYVQQGTAGNIPLAAAFAIVPILIMIVYLAIARRMGAFDAL
jgi:putative spermidine/putrescine transport system permease protein